LSDIGYFTEFVTLIGVGDMYLNTTYSRTYRCTVAGAPSTARWVYVNSIKGADGQDGQDGADGIDVTSQYMSFDTTNGLRVYSGYKSNNTYNKAFTQIQGTGMTVYRNVSDTATKVAFFGSYINQGFNSNGRLDLYKHGLENFITHPIFGGGFDSCLEDNFGHGIDPNRYHNTIIELLATCGVVGFGAYCYHRYQTIKLFIKKKSNLSCIFLGICALALLLTSLLDNHIFNLYPTMYYSIILVALGKLPTKENELS
jgi:hypothetical protein